MSIPIALLKKVRCRFLCKDSGKPVSGIVATLEIGVGEATNLTLVPLGTLQSDGAGYMSFDLKYFIHRGAVIAEKLLLSGPRLPGGGVNLLDILSAGSKEDGGDTDVSLRLRAFNVIGSDANDNGGQGAPADDDICLVFPVYVSEKPNNDETQCESGCVKRVMPSIQSPDVCDYQASPFSFVAPVASSMGKGCCETLVPSTLPIQEHKFFKVVVRRETNEGDIKLIEELGGIKEVSVTTALATQAPKLKFAEILEFKQQWYSLGHSLGEIKYSLALAPGEATQIAVIDWSRQDNISRTDSVLSTEFMDHSIKRDRSIEETIDSALKESQGGSSFMAGTSGQATIPLQYVTLSFNHAIGYGVSNSWGNRNLEADSLQDLHDRIRQQSGYTRSLNSTVVVQASQSEQNVLQTRKVANHNHCHALTVQYYEVLRHYRIRTEFSGRRKALLVPFKPFSFTWELALQFRSILESVLIDPSLQQCFDAIFRLKAVPSVYDPPTGSNGTGSTPAPTPAPAPAPILLNKDVTVFTYFLTGVGSQVFVQKGDTVRITATGEAFTGGFWTFGPDGHTDPATSDFSAPKLRKFSLICKVGSQGAWHQAGAFAEFVADGNGELIFNMNDLKTDYDNNRPFTHSQEKDRWEVNVTYPSHEVISTEPPGPTAPNTNTTGSNSSTSGHVPTMVEDSLLLTRLLAHLNGNQGYYNGCVWVLQNPIERRMRIEATLSAHSYLLDAVDDVPLAISGNYVAFAYDGPFYNWEVSRETDPINPIEDIVTLPTRGVFVEAMLGHCNACEERDPTRMWDWKEMTIETPPEIGEVTPGPKGQATSVTPVSLPGNVIQITQPPAAPDPTGLAAALKVLGTPDIFRDMSGLDEVSKLLDTLSKQSSEANIKALAQQAKDKLDSAKSSGGGTSSGSGSGSGSGGSNGSNRAPASETDAAKQVDRLKAIQYAQDKGLVSNEQGTNAAEGVLGGESTTTAGTNSMQDSLAVTINLSKYCTPAVRAFSPGDKSGQTTLRAVVTNAPVGSTWHWAVTSPTAASIVTPNSYITTVTAGDPGLTDATFEARDPGGVSLGKMTIKLSVPQFVVIDEEAATFGAQLVTFQLDDVKATLLQRMKLVVDFLLEKTNVRTVWHLAPFNELMPAHIAPGGFAAGKFSPLMIRGLSPSSPDEAGTTEAGGPTKPDDKINIYPAAFRLNGMDVGADVTAIVTRLAAMNMTDPDIKNVWIDIMARLLGETIAHEIHHALLGDWAGFVGGHNSPPIPFDLMNRGSDRNWLQRTGIEIIDNANFPKPGSYRDGGVGAISSLQMANQTKVDSVFPIPPTFM